jgi:hypothetical protein
VSNEESSSKQSVDFQRDIRRYILVDRTLCMFSIRGKMSRKDSEYIPLSMSLRIEHH